MWWRKEKKRRRPWVEKGIPGSDPGMRKEPEEPVFPSFSPTPRPSRPDNRANPRRIL
jgi:hypothetical protein